MSECHAVLLDTVSIQDYIFQSNQLKENLGASFLIGEKVYGKHLKDAAETVFGKKFDIKAWESEPDILRIRTHNDPFEVGYIGGGNALLLFREKDNAEAFVREWTKSLLIHTPGIVSAVALHEFDLDNFKESKETLFRTLRKNKAKYTPRTIVPMHGITSECRHSSLSMDVWNPSAREEDKKGEYVSAGTNARIIASISAKSDINRKYEKELKGEFCFSNELKKLGQIGGEDSHIAIVHIDGNDMGTRFDSIDSLPKMRNLSADVDNATQSAFRTLLNHIVKDYVPIMKYLGFDNKLKDKKRWYPMDKDFERKILPIRPIILGGDDITFVCDGKLGMYFSKLFIEAFEKQPAEVGGKLTACAGISIIKTKYPFYRGYKLAEDLCRNAKKVRRAKNDSCSYLDFHVSTGGISGTLEEIREKYFQAPSGKLLHRPYKLIPGSPKDEKSFDLFVKNTRKFQKDFPNNKTHQLRQVLTLSEEVGKRFLQEMKHRGRELPEIPGRSYSLFCCFEEVKKREVKVTPYFDMIELGEYYPLELNGDGDR